jgi:hypothetical protein
MPPEISPTPDQHDPSEKSSSGPVVGIIIIVVLMIVGALYAWDQGTKTQHKPQDQLPLILPGDATSTATTTPSTTITN